MKWPLLTITQLRTKIPFLNGMDKFVRWNNSRPGGSQAEGLGFDTNICSDGFNRFLLKTFIKNSAVVEVRQNNPSNIYPIFQGRMSLSSLYWGRVSFNEQWIALYEHLWLSRSLAYLVVPNSYVSIIVRGFWVQRTFHLGEKECIK